MEPLGVMAHGAPCSCVLSSPSPPPSPPSPPSPPLDPDCFWIVQMTVDCPNYRTHLVPMIESSLDAGETRHGAPWGDGPWGSM